MDGDMLSCTEAAQHEIKLLPGATPVNVRQYRIPHSHKKILQQMIDEYEKQGIIEKCHSEFNSPLLLVGKKDDFGNKTDLRFVVDYKKLNEVTQLRVFPIPRVDEILDDLGGSEYFSKLDIKGAFHQIKLSEDSQNYTAFTACGFQYRWKRMPMGLAMSPLTWQQTINTILWELIGNGVYVYLDDIIIYARTRTEHDEILRTVMEKLKQHNLQLKISKCEFYAREFEFLGHIISKDGIRTNPKKIEAVRDFPIPKNVKKVQSFLGMTNYYRRFVRRYSHIAKPLSRLCKKNQPFVWTDLCQRAFDRLKSALIEDVTLAFPDFEQTFYITTDASDYAVGGVLSQGDIPNDRPICFFSKTLNEAQRRYSTTHKELLAMVECVRAFRPYVWGRFFVMITDHKALCYLFSMRDCGSRLFRQKIELLDYNFKVIHRPGSMNSVADALSRMEPLSIEEMVSIEQGKQTCCAVTRAQTKRQADKTWTLIEKNRTILNKREYDLIFHILPTENDELRTKMEKKFGKLDPKSEWTNINDDHYVCTMSNKFTKNTNAMMTRMKEAYTICQDQTAEHIAINIDCDNFQEQLQAKIIIAEIFSSSNIGVNLFTNNVIDITTAEDIQKILQLYHESLLGGISEQIKC